MKCSIPEISWHNREPVLSIDIQPISEKFYRLATGGADCHVLIWQLNVNDNGAVKIEALSELTRHQKAVNSVRWSPSGQHLATADDDANIIIWQLKTDNVPLLEGETSDKETWIAHKVMRGHKEDIYDLCWSPSGLKLLSGSIDNTAILWDFTKGKSDQILSDHKGFVQVN
jgi:chromatin assembly factor 1 subunit B